MGGEMLVGVVGVEEDEEVVIRLAGVEDRVGEANTGEMSCLLEP